MNLRSDYAAIIMTGLGLAVLSNAWEAHNMSGLQNPYSLRKSHWKVV